MLYVLIGIPVTHAVSFSTVIILQLSNNNKKKKIGRDKGGWRSNSPSVTAFLKGATGTIIIVSVMR